MKPNNGDETLMFDGRLSVCERQWRYSTKQSEVCQGLALQYDLPGYLVQMLLDRGLPPQELATFLRPDIAEWRERARLIPGLVALVARLKEIIRLQEPLALLSDYDVDGLTSVTAMHSYLTAQGVQTQIYIPDRLGEGYGPNVKLLDQIRQQGFSNCLMLDCGTGAHVALEHAARIGLRVLVIDHHRVTEQLPVAEAICNPFRAEIPQEAEVTQDLATVGLVFFVLLELATQCIDEEKLRNRKIKKQVLPLLDLVALGTVCDIVPLLGINRPLVVYGLRQMQRTLRDVESGSPSSSLPPMNPGLLALLQEKQIVSHTFTADDLGFLIGPCINAASRLGQVQIALQLFLSDDPLAARDHAQELQSLNLARREYEQQVYQQAHVQALQALELDSNTPLLLVSGSDWPVGVIGIVAGRIAERFHRPTVIISWQGDEGVGSGRSIKGVDLGSLILQAASEGHLVQGGGHKMAVGLRLTKTQLPRFQQFCHAQQDTILPQVQHTELIDVDLFSQIDALPSLDQQLQRLAPFGCQNSAPLLALARVQIRGLRVYNQTFCCWLTDESGQSIAARLFRGKNTPLGNTLINARNEHYHCLGYLKNNYYRNQNQTYFLLKDLMLAL